MARALKWERQLAKAESTPEQLVQTGSFMVYATTDHLFVPCNRELDRMLRYEAMIARHEPCHGRIGKATTTQERGVGSAGDPDGNLGLVVLQNKANNHPVFNR
jgi:hypothetical protein